MNRPGESHLPGLMIWRDVRANPFARNTAGMLQGAVRNMGRLTTTHLVETGVWLALAVLLYVYSYEFNQGIEIYRYGASAWPRVIIVLLALAAFGNLYYHYWHGDTVDTDRIGIVAKDEDEGERNLASTLRIAGILFSPFVFAIALKPVGFYCSAPFFIAAIAFLFGERRPGKILAVTAFIYFLLLMFFVVLLNANLPQGNISPFYDVSNQILIWNTKLQKWL